MRKLLLFLLTAVTIFAQAQQINGLVKDENGAPVSTATVSLIKSSDSSSIKLAVTKEDGTYIFSGIKEGSYKIVATHTGFKPVFSPGFSLSASGVTVPELRLSKLSGTLGNVTVTAQRPMVEVKADKTILNVEGTINAVGSNALELLRKSPGVLLDKDDNISLAGKNGIQVYIDNRQTPLSGQDLANYLKTLESSQIEAIEIITNPSAKYDAAGNAGIINIRLKKNKSLGTNGSVNAGWNIAIHARYNAGFSLNYRNKKINIFSTYNYSHSLNEQNLSFKRTVLDSLFDQHAIITDRRQSHTYKAGADYFINRKNTIGLMVNGAITNPTSVNQGKTYISNTTTNNIARILIAGNTTKMKRDNTNVNLNYNYTDPKGTSLAINADHGTYDLNSDQFQPNIYYDASELIQTGSVTYHMFSPAQININSIKADYEQNFMKGKLSFGAKSAAVKTDNDFQRYNVNGFAETLDQDRSNHFIYKEKINAAYVNYNRQYKTFMIQVGLRGENTQSEGISTGQKFNGSGYEPNSSSFNRSYTDFFPSAAITLTKNPLKRWGLTYSRRIDRPAYQSLNPFEFKLDEYTFMKGNVNLRPQYTNSFGINYTYKYKLSMGTNYSHVKDMFTQIIDTTEKSKAFVSTKNLATQDIVSFTASYPFQYKSYSLFTSLNTNYSKYKSDFGTGRKIDINAFGLTLFVQNSLKLSKTCTAELSGFYNAPTIYMGSFKGKSIYNVDAGLSRQVIKGNGVIKASVSDLFYSQKFKAQSNFAGQIVAVNFRQESRQFKLSFNYRFGNNGVKPARQRSTGAEDELKRVQQSQGVIAN